MTNGVRGYLTGVCHGVAAAWLAAYVLYKSAGSLADLFDPRYGVLPVVLAPMLAWFGFAFTWRRLMRPSAPSDGSDQSQPG